MIFSKIYNIIKKQIENIEVISKYKKSRGNNSSGETSIGMLSIDEKEFEEDLKLMN